MPNAVVTASRRPAKRDSIQATTRSGGDSSPISVLDVAYDPHPRSGIPISRQKKKARRTCLRAGYVQWVLGAR